MASLEPGHCSLARLVFQSLEVLSGQHFHLFTRLSVFGVVLLNIYIDEKTPSHLSESFFQY